MTKKTSESNPSAARVGRGELGALALAIAVFLAAALIMTPFTPDDAYVSYRYAKHLSEGGGLVFNPGDPPVEGYSNFLWLLISAAVHRLGGNVPTAVPTLGAYLSVLSIVILWLLYRRRRLPAHQTLIPVLLFASSAPFVLYSVSGMETALFAALLLTAVLVFEKAASSHNTGAWILLAFTCVLLALCRPEGVLVMPLIIGYFAVTDRPTLRRRPIIVAVSIFVTAVVIYQAWRVTYFDEAVPRSLWVNSGGGMSVRVWIENMRMYLVMQGADYAPMGYYYAVLVILASIGLSLTTSSGAAKHGERLALAIVVVYAIVYVNFVDPAPGMRYHAPLIGLLFVPIAHVAGGLVKGVRFAVGRNHAVQYGIVLLALLSLSFLWVADLKLNARRLEERNQKCSVELGNWLREVEADGAVLATPDLGVVPYYSGLKTLDIGEIPLTAEPGRGRFSARYLLDQNPDVVLLVSKGQFTGEFEEPYKALVKSSEFLSKYRVRGAVRQDLFEDRSYWVFELKGITHSEDEIEKFPFGVSTVRRVNSDE
jgi:hypothetical protein